jgi:hypothetical protein
VSCRAGREKIIFRVNRRVRRRRNPTRRKGRLAKRQIVARNP